MLFNLYVRGFVLLSCFHRQMLLEKAGLDMRKMTCCNPCIVWFQVYTTAFVVAHLAVVTACLSLDVSRNSRCCWLQV